MQIALYIAIGTLALGMFVLAYMQQITRGQIVLYSLLLTVTLGMGSCAIMLNEVNADIIENE